MKVIVGSTNPVKIEAVREVVQDYWAGTEVVGVEVESGVGSQPMSEEETIRGAKNRALAALSSGAEYGVGLEGGVTEIEGELYECAWVVIVDRVGRMGMGGGLYFALPPKIAKRIRAGEELGPIMAEEMRYDVKRNNGAIGVLSRNHLDRKNAYKQLVVQTMVKWVSPEWYLD